MIEFLVLFFVGIFVGVYASVVGGGALVLVPVFSLIGTPIVSALATMRLGATIQEFVSAVAFWRKGKIAWRAALLTGLLATLGGYLGARLVINADTRFLSYVVAATMLLILIFIPRIDNQKYITEKDRLGKYKSIFLLLSGFLLGIYGGFYGAAFGVLMMLSFALVGKTDLVTSAGNARVVGFLMSASASSVFLKNSVIDWPLFFPVTAGMIFGSWFGVDTAVKYGAGWIKLLLTVVVIASIIKLIVFPG